jgi:hypothetical protein
MDSVGALVVPGDDGLDDDAKERTAKPMECSACSGELCSDGEGRLEMVQVTVTFGWRWSARFSVNLDR